MSSFDFTKAAAENANKIVEPIVSGDSSYDAFNNTAKESALKVSAKVNVDLEKAKGKTINMSAYDKNLDKLQTYGTSWAKYGYNPHLDNQKLYDLSATQTGENWSRAWEGATRLANIGFTDNFLFGAVAGKNSDKEFGKTVEMYSSNQGGVAGFTQNLVLNSGYTVGIMADMFLEEIILAGATVLSGGTAAPVTGAAMGAKAVKGFAAISKAFNGYSDFRKVMKAADVVKDANKIPIGLQKTLNFLNPASNITSFAKNLKNAETLKDATNLSKVAHGTGALFRDVKAAHLTWTEANLEGSMLKDEMYKDFIANHQGPLTDQDIAKYHSKASEAGRWAKGENVFAIGATNKLVFNNMYKAFDDLKGIGKVIGETTHATLRMNKGLATVARKGLVAETKLLFKDGLASGTKKIAKGIGAKGGTYFSANLGEGFQELAQEAIGSKNRHMYGSEHQGDYFDSMLEGMKDQLGGQGAETFLSGFLMGGLISPITASVKQVSKLRAGGYKYFTDTSNYKKSRDEELKRLDNDAALINEVFKNPKDVFDASSNNLTKQAEFDEEMVNASAVGDQHEFQNIKAKSYREHLDAMMRNNMMDEFKDHLSAFKTMDEAQFKEAFPTTDVDLSKKDRDAIIDRQIAKADSFKEHYKWVNKNIINPISYNKLDPKSPDYNEKVAEYAFFEQAKKELIHSKDEMVNNMDRKEDLMNSLRNEVEAKNIEFHEYQKLFNVDSVNKEVKLLSAEIGLLEQNETLTPEDKEILTSKKEKFTALSNYESLLSEKEIIEDSISMIEDQEVQTPAEKRELKKLKSKYAVLETKVFNGHNKYLKTISKKVEGVAFQNMSENTFSKLQDVYKLDSRNKELGLYVDILTNPAMMNERVKRDTARRDDVMAQYHRYVKNSIAQFRDKKESKSTVDALYAKGIGFDLSLMDDLTEKGIIPDTFTDLETGEAIPQGSEKHNEAVELLTDLKETLLVRPGTVRAEEQEDLENEKPIDINTPIKNYPPVMLNTLIDEYKKAVAVGDIVERGDVSLDNLTPHFLNWAQDNIQFVFDKVKAHNESVADMTTTFEGINDDQKQGLAARGFATEEEINQLSISNVNEILQTPVDEVKPEEYLEEVLPELEEEEETFDSILEKEGLTYEENTTLSLIRFAEASTEPIIGSTDFFNTVDALEKTILPMTGDEVIGFTVTPEVLTNLYNALKKYPQANKEILKQFKTKIQKAIYNYNAVAESEKIESKTKEEKITLKGLGYTTNDISKMPVNVKKDILKNNTTKKEYQAATRATEKAEKVEIKTLFANTDFNVRTIEEVSELVGELTLNNPELFEAYDFIVEQEVSKVKNRLLSLGGFKNLKEEDVVMINGILKKVETLSDKNVTLINYNNVIQEPLIISKSDFNRSENKIINDFNKDQTIVPLDIDQQNVNNLSELLRTFTGNALTPSEEVPTEEEMQKHFKLCK